MNLAATPYLYEWDQHLERAMFEVLVTAFIAAFVAVTFFGHVMVVEALMTPDHA